MGFGDSIYPLPQMRNLPSLLGFAEPRLLCYPLETAIAEKFQAMIHLDEMNSRMKDFYDIWYLSRHVKFEGSVMVEAIRLTMDKRDTVMPAELTAFSEDFVKDRQSLWKIFIERMQLENIPASLSAVVDDLKHFLLPIADAIRLQQHFAMGWDGTQWNREEV